MIKRWVAIKKAKECHACERPLSVGDRAQFWTCQQEETNRLHSDHWCPQCAEWAVEVNAMGETVWGGDFLDRRLAHEAPTR